MATKNGKSSKASTVDQWEISVEVSEWKIKDKRGFLKTMLEVEESKDEEPLFKYFVRLIRRWPFPYDPAIEASYDELTLVQFGEVMTHVLAAFQAAGPAADASGVPGGDGPAAAA